MAKTRRYEPAESTRATPAVPPTAPQKHLDVFANPARDRDYLIEFEIPEFTCNLSLIHI